MRFVLTSIACLMITTVSAAERPADADELIFLGEFATLETGLQPEDLGFPSDRIDWDDLDATQQQILGEVADGWDDLEDEERWWLVLGAVRWADLPGRKRREVDDHLLSWNQLSAAQQDRIRENLRRFSALDEAQRRALRERYRSFSNLSPGQQRSLRDAYEGMSESERDRLRERLLEHRPATVDDPDEGDGT
jgi:hypothetical protein